MALILGKVDHESRRDVTQTGPVASIFDPVRQIQTRAHLPEICDYARLVDNDIMRRLPDFFNDDGSPADPDDLNLFSERMAAFKNQYQNNHGFLLSDNLISLISEIAQTHTQRRPAHICEVNALYPPWTLEWLTKKLYARSGIAVNKYFLPMSKLHKAAVSDMSAAGEIGSFLMVGDSDHPYSVFDSSSRTIGISGCDFDVLIATALPKANSPETAISKELLEKMPVVVSFAGLGSEAPIASFKVCPYTGMRGHVYVKDATQEQRDRIVEICNSHTECVEQFEP